MDRYAEHSEAATQRSEEHTSELQSLAYLVCRLLLEKKKYSCATSARVDGNFDAFCSFASAVPTLASFSAGSSFIRRATSSSSLWHALSHSDAPTAS